MKERELNFRQNEDKTPVSFSPEKKKAVLKQINDLRFLAQHLHESIEKEDLSEGFKETCSSLLESYTRELLKGLDYDSVLEREAKSRVEQVRSLNVENRLLRQQLGGKATAEDVRECLKSIDEKIRDFWRKEGFQYLEIKDFGPYCLRTVLHTSCLRGFWHGSTAELECHIEKLKGYGLELCGSDETKKDDALVFSTSNIEALKGILSKYFSDFDIGGSKGASRRGGPFFIKEIEVNFRNYDELLNMPFDTYVDKEKVRQDSDRL